MKRKSQSGTNAAILIAIISALIILYIVFLPTDERLELIGENDTNGNNDDDNGGKLLVEDTEIIMEHFKEDEIEYDLPSVNLYTKTGAENIVSENAIYVKSSAFEQESKEIPFTIDDPGNTENVILSFFAKKNKGRLMITLNGREIYNSEISQVNVDPIRLPKSLLAEKNDLKLEVSGVGAAFWATNEFLLEGVKITADVTDLSATESELTFVVPKSEANNIDEARLRFVPECQPERVGILDIELNNREIFSAIPDCGNPRPLDFSPNLIRQGENTLTFKTEEGRYLIDRIRVTTELEETPSFTYFFDLDEDDFEDIQNEDKVVNVTLHFVDDDEDKEAEFIINGGLGKRSMRRHDDAKWSVTLIKDHLEEGSNSIKIIPQTRLEIRKLQIRLVNKDDD